MDGIKVRNSFARPGRQFCFLIKTTKINASIRKIIDVGTSAKLIINITLSAQSIFQFQSCLAIYFLTSKHITAKILYTYYERPVVNKQLCS